MPRFPYPPDVNQDLRDLFRLDRQARTARDLGASAITRGEGSMDLYETNDGPAVARYGDLPDGSFGVGVVHRGSFWNVSDLIGQGQDHDAAQDGRLDGHDATLGSHDSRITNAQVRANAAAGRADAARGVADDAHGRLDGHATRLGNAEGRLDNHAGRIGSAEGRLDSHAGRIGATETKNGQQDTRLTNVEARNTAQDGRIATAQDQADSAWARANQGMTYDQVFQMLIDLGIVRIP